MALIPVGIHENLVLSDKTTVNEKGSLVLVIKSSESPNAVMDAFESNSNVVGMESSFTFFFPNLIDFEKRVRSGVDIAEDLLTLRFKLTNYARLYATKEEVDSVLGGKKIFEGLGIPEDQTSTIVARLTNEEFMHKVVTSYYHKFINFIKSKNGFAGTVKFRQKFPRASKDKNFSSISNSSIDVWLESMDIPKTQSKVAFTEWEIKNGKNDSTPGKSDAPQNGENAAEKAATLFSQPATPAESIPQPVLGATITTGTPVFTENPNQASMDAMKARQAQAQAEPVQEQVAAMENIVQASNIDAVMQPPQGNLFTGLGN